MSILNAGTLELKLEIVPVKSLLQHERTIKKTISTLLLEFKNWANLQNPIIIDDNHVILDGNHRAMVFRELHYQFIPVCKINYFNPKVLLKYWFRKLSPVKNARTIKNVLSARGMTINTLHEQDEIIPALEKDRFSIGLKIGTFIATAKFHENAVSDAVSAYDALEEVTNAMLVDGTSLEYIPCQYMSDPTFCKALEETDLIIYTPRITKEMIVDAAKRGKVFAPKTTRHIIPARPINVNIPVAWFNRDVPLKTINEQFKKHLESKSIKHFGPGQIIDGRYYSEELFVFIDKK
ncbi:MAG: hypothetical protein ACTSUE_17265 [Promethearchaeota archaeon]